MGKFCTALYFSRLGVESLKQLIMCVSNLVGAWKSRCNPPHSMLVDQHNVVGWLLLFIYMRITPTHYYLDSRQVAYMNTFLRIHVCYLNTTLSLPPLDWNRAINMR